MLGIKEEAHLLCEPAGFPEYPVLVACFLALLHGPRKRLLQLAEVLRGERHTYTHFSAAFIQFRNTDLNDK